jgi:hypothetical protein
MHDIPLHGAEYITSILSRRDRHTVINFVWDGDGEEDRLKDESVALQAALTQALLREGALDLIAMLFDDIRTLSAHPITTTTDELEVIRRFPTSPTITDRLDFAHRLMATLMTMTWKITVFWVPPACTAEEMMLHLIMDQAERLDDLHDVGLDDHWRHLVSLCLLEDSDYESFFFDGLPADFDIWEPFRPGTDEVHPFQESSR